ncbi:MAG: hypothetical protein JJ868_14730 [Shimia sp.]|uniref:hypothetical protein n=1 Tax=Shimia sp. TaxID=1954381 RepID=UPI001B0E7197|nr:hypothetical protein [Shimia sp.]MBO6898625.1 hypothetical protein [Shimia sp.]
MPSLSALLQKLLLSLTFALFANTASAMFIQPDWLDPTEPGVGTNRYAYSANDPINRIDPNGNKSRLAALIESVGDWLKGDSALTGTRGINRVEGARRAAVNDAWKMEQQMVQKLGYGTRAWEDDELALLAAGKKVPDYVGHHMTSVSADLRKAASHKNIQFMTRKKHAELHKQNDGFQKPIESSMEIDRTMEGILPDLATAGARAWPERVGNALKAVSESRTIMVIDLFDPTAVIDHHYQRTHGYSLWELLPGNRRCRGPMCI